MKELICKFFSLIVKEIAEYYDELKELIREIVSILAGFIVAGLVAVAMFLTVFDPITIYFDHGRTDEPVSSAIAALFVIAIFAAIVGLFVMGLINPPEPINFDMFDEKKAEIRKNHQKLVAQRNRQKEYDEANEVLEDAVMYLGMYEYANGGPMTYTERRKLCQTLNVDMD